MILIAESGSTKTSWVLINNEYKRVNFLTSGFNPFVQKREEISSIIKEELMPNTRDIRVEQIYFYGAGCSTEENKKLMHSCFKSFYNKASIEIEHDLLAAARGLWHNESGIVSILGTGSNSCVFDGKSIIEAVPSLGFILGDEGSGAFMGKQLLCDYFYKKLPDVIALKLTKEYMMEIDKVLNRIYKKDNPNRWMASFSIFIRDNIKEPYCVALVENSFRAFFEAHIKQYGHYKDLPLGVIGSIGYYYKDFFDNIASEYGFSLKKIIKSPIDELVRYHLPTQTKQNVAGK